jgi:hypothetical protein
LTATGWDRSAHNDCNWAQIHCNGTAIRTPRSTLIAIRQPGVEATLNRNGYTTKVLTEMLGVKSAELRRSYGPCSSMNSVRSGARDLKEQMLAAGFPCEPRRRPVAMRGQSVGCLLNNAKVARIQNIRQDGRRATVVMSLVTVHPPLAPGDQATF